MVKTGCSCVSHGFAVAQVGGVCHLCFSLLWRRTLLPRSLSARYNQPEITAPSPSYQTHSGSGRDRNERSLALVTQFKVSDNTRGRVDRGEGKGEDYITLQLDQAGGITRLKRVKRDKLIQDVLGRK